MSNKILRRSLNFQFFFLGVFYFKRTFSGFNWIMYYAVSYIFSWGRRKKQSITQIILGILFWILMKIYIRFHWNLCFIWNLCANLQHITWGKSIPHGTDHIFMLADVHINSKFMSANKYLVALLMDALQS